MTQGESWEIAINNLGISNWGIKSRTSGSKHTLQTSVMQIVVGVAGARGTVRKQLTAGTWPVTVNIEYPDY